VEVLPQVSNELRVSQMIRRLEADDALVERLVVLLHVRTRWITIVCSTLSPSTSKMRLILIDPDDGVFHDGLPGL
jgi:hypothetical protein